MKRILVLLLLLAVPILAQNSDKNSRTMTGDNVLYNSYQTTKELIRVGIVADSTSMFPVSFGFTDTISYFSGGTGRTDTLVGLSAIALFKRKVSGTAVVTSLADTLKQYWSASIIADDTMEVTTSSTFPTIETIVVLPNAPLTLGPYSITQKNNLYLRRKTTGTTSGCSTCGTPRYYVYITGI